MSCESPFVIPQVMSPNYNYAVTYRVGCTGSVSVPEYTVPSTTTCPSGTIVWPNFLLSGTASIPIQIKPYNGDSIVISPPTSPIQTSSLVIFTFDFNYNLNGTDYLIPINLGTNGLLVLSNGESFSSSVLLGTFTESFVSDGFTIPSTFTFTLLFCLNPEPPNGWITLQVGIEFTTSACNASYSTSFLLNLPISSVQSIPRTTAY